MEEQPYQQPYPTKSHIFVFFGGVLLPIISISLEAGTHVCANVFFDPIPTVWHLLLVVFVPLAQLQGWFAIRRADPHRLMLAGITNSAVIVISFFYSIVYLPLFPLGAMLILVGVGVLPLTPLFSLIAALLIRRNLKRIAARAPEKNFALSRKTLVTVLLATAAVIGLIELPATLTRIGLKKAASASAEERTEGIRFLRQYGNKDALLRSCYARTGWATDLIGYGFSVRSPVTPAEGQKIYYRVTGETFDSSAPPPQVGGRVNPQDEFDFDPDQGGVNVGAKLKGLSLASSKLDGSVDADGGVGYMQWTLVFKNESAVQREARAQVQLPPGGVVSRLTLWVNGEEREAAFGGRSQVRNAYQQVAIRQQRDPVLVTTAGRDRIQVQCFPVPPGNEMKIRIGITVPLIFESVTDARLLMPYFANRNFRIADDVKHSVWIESKQHLEGWTREGDQTEAGAFVFRNLVRDADLSHPLTSIWLKRAAVREMWSKDPFDPKFVVTQSIKEQMPAHLRRIVVVVDTSEAMRSALPEIKEAIKSLPEDVDLKWILADNDGSSDGKDLAVLWRGDVDRLLSNTTFGGGADNEHALLKAWDVAAGTPGNNAIVWIHAPQRLLFGTVEELRQRLERRPYGPTLYSFKTTVGADEIEAKLDGIDEVKSVARADFLNSDLRNLFARLTSQTPAIELVRSSKKMDQQLDLSNAVETSDHLARLWANDEVRRIMVPGDTTLTDAATALAVRYQLVTPVSGAVVLETEQQYRANDLKPVAAGTVPTIPEPETAALILIATVFILGLLYVKYGRARRGSCTI
jgi:hypothetical protein